MRLVVLAALGALLLFSAGCADEQPNQTIIDDGTLPPDLQPTTTAATLPPNDLGPPTLDDASTVSTIGIDTVTFGMTVADAEVAAGARFVPVDAEPDATCYDARPIEGPQGLTFTLDRDTVERLDVTGSIMTPSGAGVGTSLDELALLFGDRLRTEDHGDGTATASFVPADPEDANYRIIFDVTDGVVVAYRSGRLPVVRDGC